MPESIKSHARVVVIGGRIAGCSTSGGYGHRVQKNSAYAFIEPSLSAPDTCLQIEILGEKYEAKVCEPRLYDPENTKVRS